MTSLNSVSFTFETRIPLKDGECICVRREYNSEPYYLRVLSHVQDSYEVVYISKEDFELWKRGQQT